MIKPRGGSLTPEIIRLAKQGIDRREIARRVGCTPPNVYKTLVRYGVILPARPLPVTTRRTSTICRRCPAR